MQMLLLVLDLCYSMITTFQLDDVENTPLPEQDLACSAGMTWWASMMKGSGYFAFRGLHPPRRGIIRRSTTNRAPSLASLPCEGASPLRSPECVYKGIIQRYLLPRYTLKSR